MISCRRATELISKSLDEKLSLKERTALYLHLFICEFCEIYKKNLENIRKSLVNLDQNSTPEEFDNNCDNSKKRLISKIKKTTSE